MNNSALDEKFIAHMSEVLKEHRNRPILAYGLRVESMFSYVAAGLGNCQIITEEDAGVYFSIDENLRRPDFRLLLCHGDQFFVEVKNYHESNPRRCKPYRFKKSYLFSLQKYAEKFKIPLKFAIYWSRWNLWSLVDVKYLEPDGLDYYKLTLPQAMKRNEMAILGDCDIGTVPPLSLRLYPEPKKQQSIKDDGTVHFTIGQTALYSAEQEVFNHHEKQIAWRLMLFGNWQEFNNISHTENGKLKYVELSVTPEEWDKDQGFSLIGSYSQIISNQYKEITSPEGHVDHLTPNQQPNKLRFFIPKEYKGEVLHLWRFHQTPSYN